MLSFCRQCLWNRQIVPKTPLTSDNTTLLADRKGLGEKGSKRQELLNAASDHWPRYKGNKINMRTVPHLSSLQSQPCQLTNGYTTEENISFSPQQPLTIYSSQREPLPPSWWNVDNRYGMPRKQWLMLHHFLPPFCSDTLSPPSMTLPESWQGSCLWLTIWQVSNLSTLSSYQSLHIPLPTTERSSCDQAWW